MKVVLPQGDIVTLGNKCVKHVAGFNMEGIFVGSEGLLGIMTELTLALLPILYHSYILQATIHPAPTGLAPH